MDKRKSQSINNKKKLVKRSTELSKVLDNPKNSIENLNEFKKGCFLLFNKMLNGFALHKIILDKEGKPCDYRFLEVNPAFEKLTGLKRADIIGKTVLEVLPGLQPYWIDTYGKVAMTGKSVQSEHYSQPLSKYYEVNVYSPKKGYFITIFSELEEESRIFKRYFEKYLEYASALFLVLDKEGNISLINKKGVELLGYPKEEIIGKNWFMNFLPEEIRSETKKYFMKIVRGEVPIDDYYENPVITKYGVKMLRWQNTLLKDSDGEIIGNLASAGDITERKRMEEEMKRFATVDSLTQIFNKKAGIETLNRDIEASLSTKTLTTLVFIDANGLKLVNDTYGHIEGDECLKLIARNLSDRVGEAGTVFRFGGDELIILLPKSDKKKAVKLLNEIEKAIENLSSELQKPYKMSISYGFAVFDPEHPVSSDTLLATADKEMNKMKNSFYGHNRARAEEALQESLDRWRATFDSISDIVCVISYEHKFLAINEAGVRALNLPHSEIIGRKCYELVHGTTSPIPVCPCSKVIKTGLEESSEYEQGGRFYSLEAWPLKDESGNVTSFVHIVKDITERKRAEEALKNSNKQLEKSVEDIIFTIAKMSESKDPYTAGHQKRVSQLAMAIARKMGLTEDKIESIKFASLIHDIGKISIPGDILSKPSKLSEIEFALIKEHPKTCYDIIKEVDFPWEIAPIILQHHERLDGSGYPEGLKDKEILLEAKILAVADVVEAMNSFRPYRAALGIDKALEEISMNKGKLYDPEVVDACIKLFKEDEFKFE